MSSRGRTRPRCRRRRTVSAGVAQLRPGRQPMARLRPDGVRHRCPTMPQGGPGMTDPIADIIGDYRAFAAQQRDRLLTRGIDITPYELGHLAYRVPEWDQYLHVRGLLE